MTISLEIEIENGPLTPAQQWNLAEQVAAGKLHMIFANAGCNVSDYWVEGVDDARGE